MSDYAFRYVRNRMVFVIAMLVIALGFGSWLLSRGEPGVRTVTGTVLEVSQGRGESLRSGGTATLVTARVRLEDGREVLVLAGGQPLQPGEAVSLVETSYPEGEPRFRLQPAEN